MNNSTRVVTPPTFEPVTLAEAKAHFRIEHNLDDAFIAVCVQAAREHAEEHCWRGIPTQTLEYILPAFPCEDYITLPRGGLASVTSVKYLRDTDGAQQTWNASNYMVDSVAVPGKVRLAYGISWPSARDQYNAVAIQYVVGWDAASTPAPIKAAILILAAQMYEYRTVEVLGTIVSKVGFTFNNLLDKYRINRF